jgi:hypothetical protein
MRSCASGVACPRKVRQFKTTCPQRAPESGTAYPIEIKGAGLFSRHFQGAFLRGEHPRVETRLKPRLRKAYVAAKLFDYAGRQTRARRSVTKEAWAKPFSPFGAQSLYPFLIPRCVRHP